jgi:hypothetical protein
MRDHALPEQPAPPPAHRRFPGVTAPPDADMLRGLLLFGTAWCALLALAYLATTQWTWPFPRDKVGLVLGRDFLNLWMYGRAAFGPDPARFYDIAIYNGELARLLGRGYPGQNWPNPPTALLVMAPFGLLGYFPALLAWFAAGLLAFGLAVRRVVSDGRILAIMLLSPAALLCAMSGQSSLLTTAALLAIFAWLDKRPLAAGILIGFLTVKPQLGVLFPIALIASARWQVFGWAALTALVLLALSVALGGWEIWHAYIVKALPLQREVLGDGTGAAMPFHPTVFMNMRSLVGNQAGEAIQLGFAVAAVAVVAAAFRVARADDARLPALFFACSIGASPYMGAYDCLPLTTAAIALLAAGRLDRVGRRVAQLIFWTPALQLMFGTLQLPGPGFIAPAFAAYLVMQIVLPDGPTEQTVVLRSAK